MAEMLRSLPVVALLLAGSVAATSIPTSVASAGVYTQSFEDANWAPGTDYGDWHGYSSTMTRATGGHGASDGSAYATVGSASGSAYTRFGGYRTDFQGGFTASIDVYLDPTNWGNGVGFDWSVAVTRQNGDHLRDYIFHVANYDNTTYLYASNNSSNCCVSSKGYIESIDGHATITDSGWYTFEHEFFQHTDGYLAANMRVLNGTDTVAAFVRGSMGDNDFANVIGGNRYGWLTFNTVDGLAIDNVSLEVEPIPLPAAVWFMLTAVGGLFGARWMRKGRAA